MKLLKKYDKQTDLQLIELYKKTAKPKYLGELYKQYAGFTLAVCMKYLKNEEESKDAVMDIFEKLTFDLKSHKIQHFKSWLYMVIKNHCLMKLRADKSKHDHLQQIKIEQEFFMENQEFMHLNNKETNIDYTIFLENALNSLKDEQQMCLRMFYFDNKSYEQIEQITGFEIKKVKSYLQNGKRNLQIMLKDKFPVNDNANKNEQ